MLVLSRKIDQQIVITVPPSTTPTTITLTCVEIRSDNVRLGIEAPREVAVHRKEIQEKIERQKL